jgi:hypothetical protein
MPQLRCRLVFFNERMRDMPSPNDWESANSQPQPDQLPDPLEEIVASMATPISARAGLAASHPVQTKIEALPPTTQEGGEPDMAPRKAKAKVELTEDLAPVPVPVPVPVPTEQVAMIPLADHQAEIKRLQEENRKLRDQVAVSRQSLINAKSDAEIKLRQTMANHDDKIYELRSFFETERVRIRNAEAERNRIAESQRYSQAQLLANSIVNEGQSLSSSVQDNLFTAIPQLVDIMFRCENCDELCLVDNRITVVETQECMCEACAEADADLYYWDDSWHNQPEPDEDESDDDEASNDLDNAGYLPWQNHNDMEDFPGYLPGYHCTKINYPVGIAQKANILGIELETYQKKFNEACAFFKKYRIESNGAFKYERDGSLDSRHGIELASIPYTLEEIRDTDGPCVWHKLISWSKENGGTAWDAGPNYGMHISLNKRAMTSIHVSKVVRFFASNRDLCERIAGRSENDFAKFTPKRRLVQERYEDVKYLAAAVRGDRIEVRIFRASLNWTRFVRNCEFVDAVRVYTMLCSIRQLTEKSFVEWLSQPANRAYYPLIYKFLVIDKRRDVVLPPVTREVALTVE